MDGFLFKKLTMDLLVALLQDRDVSLEAIGPALARLEHPTYIPSSGDVDAHLQVALLIVERDVNRGVAILTKFLTNSPVMTRLYLQRASADRSVFLTPATLKLAAGMASDNPESLLTFMAKKFIGCSEDVVALLHLNQRFATVVGCRSVDMLYEALLDRYNQVPVAEAVCGMFLCWGVPMRSTLVLKVRDILVRASTAPDSPLPNPICVRALAEGTLVGLETAPFQKWLAHQIRRMVDTPNHHRLLWNLLQPLRRWVAMVKAITICTELMTVLVSCITPPPLDIIVATKPVRQHLDVILKAVPSWVSRSVVGPGVARADFFRLMLRATCLAVLVVCGEADDCRLLDDAKAAAEDMDWLFPMDEAPLDRFHAAMTAARTLCVATLADTSQQPTLASVGFLFNYLKLTNSTITRTEAKVLTSVVKRMQAGVGAEKQMFTSPEVETDVKIKTICVRLVSDAWISSDREPGAGVGVGRHALFAHGLTFTP